MNDPTILTDAIELVLDECQAWDADPGLLEYRFGSVEGAALRKLDEAYTAWHKASAGELPGAGT